MCTKLPQRILQAAELLVEHKEVAFSDKDIRKKYRTVDKMVEFLWETLNRMGVDDSELGFKLIEKKLITYDKFHIHVKPVWKKIAWDIMTKGSIQWPDKENK